MAEGIIEMAVMVPAILSATIPSPFQARDRAHDPRSRNTARIGELVGGGLVLVLGVAESWEERNWRPLLVVIVVAGAWIWMSEWMLRNPMEGGSGAVASSSSPPLGKLV